MEKLIASIGMILLPFCMSASNENLEKVRKGFSKCTRDSDHLEPYLESLESFGSENPVVMAYKGAAKAMMAEQVMSPFSKYNYFTEGTALIEKAIERAPQNTELRYLRFIVQSKSPSFLSYNQNITEDLDRITLAIANCTARELWMDDFSAFIRANQSSYNQEKTEK